MRECLPLAAALFLLSLSIKGNAWINDFTILLFVINPLYSFFFLAELLKKIVLVIPSNIIFFSLSLNVVLIHCREIVFIV